MGDIQMQRNENDTLPFLVDSLVTRAIPLFPASLKTTKGTKWGYINNKGNFIIKPRYDFAQDFQRNGLAIVSVKSQSGIINTSGEFVVKPKYNSISSFSEGRAIVITKQGFQVINEKGQKLTKKAYHFISSYKNGRAIFSGTDSKNTYRYGYLDRSGDEVIPLTYLSASDFQNGRAVVQLKENEFALIDPRGKITEKYLHPFVGHYGEGLLAFQQEKEGFYGYMNEKGKVVIPPKFKNVQAFHDGVAIVNDSKDYLYYYGLINKKGEYIFKPEYHDIHLLGENRLAVGQAINKEKPYLGLTYAIADYHGQFLTEFIYDHVLPFDKGYASVATNEETFFIDKNGKKAHHLPVIKGSGSMFLEGSVIKAVVNMRTYYLDKLGHIIWEQNRIIPLTNKIKLIEHLYQPNKDYIIYYPKLQGMMTKEREVNKKLEDLAKVDVKPDTSYSGDFSIEFFKNHLLVLELYGYEYPFGAAHGMPTKVYPHLDLITGEFYELGDLFKPNRDYVKVLSEIIGHQIKTNEQYSYVFPDSYKGISENQPFYVNQHALMIYFPPYEIAPYVAGFPTFTIPFTEIDAIIDKQGPFWRSFH